MPEMSVILTIASLGTRVALSYWLAAIPSIGVTGIWWSIPIGWFIADMIGIIYYKYRKKLRVTTYIIRIQLTQKEPESIRVNRIIPNEITRKNFDSTQRINI